MIRQEVRLLVSAVQFLTRLPTPALADWQPQWLSRAAKYFPLVGALVGALSAAVFIAARLVWPTGLLPALFAVAAGVLITGGFHEDGLADTADGLGGGQTPQGRLEIMKDSRIGTYGLLGLGLGIAAKVAALGSLPAWAGAAVLIGAHAMGRAAAVVAMTALPYAADPAASKLKPMPRDVSVAEAAVALILGAIWLLWLSPLAALICVTVGGALALWPALAARRLIGGQTGDVLGAVEQAFEIGFLLAAAALAARGVVLGAPWT